MVFNPACVSTFVIFSLYCHLGPSDAAMARSRRATACLVAAAALLGTSALAADVPKGNKGKLLPNGASAASCAFAFESGACNDTEWIDVSSIPDWDVGRSLTVQETLR